MEYVRQMGREEGDGAAPLHFPSHLPFPSDVGDPGGGTWEVALSDGVKVHFSTYPETIGEHEAMRVSS